MEHVDAEVLALVALGERAGDEPTRAHLATCGECSAEVASFTRAVTVGRSLTAADSLQPPPDAVWAGIRSELGLSAALRPDGQAGPGGDAAGAAGAGRHTLTGDPVLAPAPLSGGSAAPGPGLRPRRHAPWIAAAAAAGVIVGGAGGAWWAKDRQGEAPAVLAEATLDPLPGWQASGAAVVEENPDGGRVLILTLEADQTQTGFREVWLIDREVTRLVSLGVLEGSSGRFTVPEGLDLSDFAIVDVSEEPLDGNPAHSGDSVIRGTLNA